MVDFRKIAGFPHTFQQTTAVPLSCGEQCNSTGFDVHLAAPAHIEQSLVQLGIWSGEACDKLRFDPNVITAYQSEYVPMNDSLRSGIYYDGNNIETKGVFWGSRWGCSVT